MEKMKEQFRELRSLLNEKEKLLLTQLEEVEKETAKKRDEHLARISRELSSLGGLIREMEEKCQQLPGELLQDVRSVLQRCEKEETFQNLITFPSELNAKISEVSDRNNSLVGLMKQLKANVTLDPDTAHTSITLSEDCKSVTCGDKLEDLLNSSWIALSEDHKSVTSGEKTQNLHDNSERFSECHYVLGREGFTGERLYWEVTVGSEGDWAVGVARKTLRRKGFFELSTEEGIWAIQKYDIWGGRSEYRASSYSVKAVLPPSGNVRRVRVSLNCKEGEVAFHDGDTGTHLYTFSGVSFSGETLLPFFTLQGKNNKKNVNILY